MNNVHLLRADGRTPNEPRNLSLTPGYQESAEGSCLIKLGNTQVLCAATIEERVPHFLRGTGKGWVTAEYSMLPRSTNTRTSRDRGMAISSRTLEIQRFIGRCLRAVTNREALGERTVVVDCDVIQADGGTRTTAVTGAYVSLYQALTQLTTSGIIREMPLWGPVAAISVGRINGQNLLDLSYVEDSQVDLDFNVAMTNKYEIVEIQGAAEGSPFSKTTIIEMVDLAEQGIELLTKAQQEAIEIITNVSA